ncbi:Uncharacterised protein [Lysinibacillus sphaericus]|nr:Uncharacterised protein [Lysinibacillus sphaericus]
MLSQALMLVVVLPVLARQAIQASVKRLKALGIR